MKCGFGRLIYKNGDQYLGDWNHGEREGKGIYIWGKGDY